MDHVSEMTEKCDVALGPKLYNIVSKFSFWIYVTEFFTVFHTVFKWT